MSCNVSRVKYIHKRDKDSRGSCLSVRIPVVGINGSMTDRKDRDKWSLLVPLTFTKRIIK